MFTTSMLDFNCLFCSMFSSGIPFYDSTDDLIGGLGCYARGMARTHDGLMMLLMIRRNRVLSLVVYFLSVFLTFVMLFMFTVMFLLACSFLLWLDG